MRIRGIAVSRLFGIFDHTIPLNGEDRITIIYGPNGFGKTFTLNLANALLCPARSSYDELVSVPFDEISVSFDDDSVLRLVKEGESLCGLHFELTRKGKKKQIFACSDDTTSEAIREPAWLREIKQAVDVRLIHTERLTRLGGAPASSLKAVDDYDTELKALVQAKLAKYAELSQSLDRTFPVRLIRHGPDESLSTETLRKRLRELEDMRTRYATAGLIDSDHFDLDALGDVSDGNLSVLAVYIEDAEKKLAVFDDLATRIELFIDIVNNRFTHKRMEISRQEGFLFRASDGRALEPGHLSSGEQHLVVLLYELLFKVVPDSLILIDEPELSLHIVWQQQFVRDLQRIIACVGFDIVVATHSPQIINDRWDLAVELKDPRE